MKIIKLVILLILALPAITVGLIFAVIVRLAIGGTLKTHRLGFICNIPARGWFALGPYRKWAGTVIGTCAMYKGTPSNETIKHERHHIRQFITYAIASALLGAVVGIVHHNIELAVQVWFLGMWFPFIGGFVLASLLGQDVYRDSTHERAAYAVGKSI